MKKSVKIKFKSRPRIKRSFQLRKQIFIIIFLFFCLSALQIIRPESVWATPGMRPFGGRITIIVPPIVPPAPPCPAHTVIFDIVSKRPLGLFVAPGSRIYNYKNLLTPGVSVLGEAIPVPFISCPFPYEVLPIYLVGTSAIP